MNGKQLKRSNSFISTDYDVKLGETILVKFDSESNANLKFCVYKDTE